MAMSEYSRRQFLHDSLLTAAAAATAGAVPSMLSVGYAAEKRAKGPNEKLNFAVIGVHGQGRSHIKSLLDDSNTNNRNDAEITVICDVDEQVGQKCCDDLEKQLGRRPKYVRDLREVFDDPSIDCVSMATPNHWHALGAIWALQAGKDVYVEKPVSHNVSEGRRMVEAARKYNRICQAGTQCRSHQNNIDAMKYIQDGKIGEVKLARGLCYKRRKSIGPAGVYQVPAHIDYDLWCGPAPLKPPTRNSKERGPVHYDWHWIWDYGNGDLGNQGIHQMDICRWALGQDKLPVGVISYGGRLGYEDAGETPNTQVIVLDYGPQTLVFEVRGLETSPLSKSSSGVDLEGREAAARVGIIVEGTDGYLVTTSYNRCAAFDKNGKLVKTFASNGSARHHANFIKAVRSRDQADVFGDILEGHLSSALCHLGNISYQLGSKVSNGEIVERLGAIKMADNAQDTLDRTVEHLSQNGVKLGGDTLLQCGEYLKIDPETETFIGNEKANEMCSREYRKGFELPTTANL